MTASHTDLVGAVQESREALNAARGREERRACAAILEDRLLTLQGSIELSRAQYWRATA